MKAQCAFEECSADRYASFATRTIPKIAAAPSQFHRPPALWAIGRSPHMLNSVSQIAWRNVGRDPSGLILRECAQHMRIGEQTGGRLTHRFSTSLLKRKRCQLCKQELCKLITGHNTRYKTSNITSKPQAVRIAKPRSSTRHINSLPGIRAAVSPIAIAPLFPFNAFPFLPRF